MPRTPTLTADQRAELIRAAAVIPEGRRAAFVEEQASLLACHPSTIYRVLERVTPVRSRRRRSDAGALRAIDEETFLDLAALTVRFDFDAATAIDLLNANRQKVGLPEIEMTATALRRHLAARRVSRRHNDMDLRVHRRWESPYSNHIHQIDSTQAHCYYIDRGGSIGHETPDALNRNKAGNGKPRVWLIHMIDDHSRTKWGRFYTSEAAVSWRDLMFRAWARPADPSTWPAYGMPELVYSDQGSGLKSLETRRMLGELGVKWKMADPSTPTETNAQAKGKVERGIQMIQAFELFTRMVRFECLDEMNAQFQKFLLYHNRLERRATRQSPFHRFLAGMQDRAVRLLPPAHVLSRLQYVPTERLINKSMAIQLEGQTYQLPFREPFISHQGQKVPVHYRRHDLARIIVVLDREEHEIDAVIAEPDVAGEFKSAPAPEAVKLKRALHDRDLAHLDPHLVHDYRLDKTDETFLVALREQTHPLAAAAARSRMIRHGKAIDRLAGSGVIDSPPSAGDLRSLDALFAGRPEITETELELWVAQRAEASTPPTAPTLNVMRA